MTQCIDGNFEDININSAFYWSVAQYGVQICSSGSVHRKESYYSGIVAIQTVCFSFVYYWRRNNVAMTLCNGAFGLSVGPSICPRD
jgi:hypothetical protein